MLRAIGAYLDARGATDLSVIEASDGFFVRHAAAGDVKEHELVQFSYEELLARKAELEGRRGPGSWRRRGGAGGRYQDFLRALGYELEQLAAYSILIDEQDDRFVITYQYLDPTRGYVWYKRMATVGQNEQEVILRDARGRRMNAQARRGLFRRSY